MRIEWTAGPPTEPGTYLVRDGDTNALIKLRDWEELALCAVLTWHCRLEIPEPQGMPPPGRYFVRYAGGIHMRNIDSNGVVFLDTGIASPEPWTAYEWGPRTPKGWE